MAESRVIYLAYPMDQTVGGDDPMVIDMRLALRAAGLGWYDPGRAFGNLEPLEAGPMPSKVHHAALSWANGMLAYLPRGVPSVGVPIEIERATRGMGMPTAVLTDVKGWMLQPFGDTLATFEPSIGGVDAAVAWLKQTEYTRDQRRGPLPYQLLCTCVTSGPDLDGPSEDCPEHGRPEWVAEIDQQFRPKRAYPDDAGFDLTVSRDTWIPEGEAVDVPCGIAVELEPWHFGMIFGRSSTRRSRGLMVHPGIIDPGWRGELFVNVECLKPEMETSWTGTGRGTLLKMGERIGQLIVLGNSSQSLVPVRVRQLSPHPRGLNGFGSSGK